MIGAGDTPLLPRGVRMHRDEVRQTWVLLAPERSLMLDAVGHAILTRVDGQSTVAQIAEGLAKAFEAPLEQVTSDSLEFLSALHDRRIVDIAL